MSRTQGVFSIYDSKAKTFLTPFFSVNAAIACRMVQDALNDPQHMFAKYPADFTLFQICEFDDSMGMFSTDGPAGDPFVHVNLGSLLTFMPEASNV